MLRLMDTHIHLDDEKYQADLETVVLQAQKAGVEMMINAGSTVAANKRILELVEQYDQLYAGIGLHPHEFPKTPLAAIEVLREQLAHEKVVALGEIGLDYHVFPDYPLPDKEAQKAAFRVQLGLAKIFELPVIIHVREAMDDALDILKEQEPYTNGGVMHCYAGGETYLQDVLDLGFYIGIGGPVTYPKADAIRAVATMVPLERLLLETDGPYLPPQGKRGQRNEPAWVSDVAHFIADLRGISVETLSEQTTVNAEKCFKIKKEKFNTIVYDIKGHLYVNLTNRCSSHCVFCPRKARSMVQEYDLTLHREPLAQEIIAAIGDPKVYSEIVFCGFGEPTLRLPVLLEVAKTIKAKGGMVRVNSNGQADLIFGRDILPECKDLIDYWSISVNTINKEHYQKFVKPATGLKTHEKIIDFAKRAVEQGFGVTLTDVDIPGIDLDGMEKLAEQIGARYRGRTYQRLGEPEQ